VVPITVLGKLYTRPLNFNLLNLKHMKKKTSRRNFLVKTGIGFGAIIGMSTLGCGPVRRMLAKQVDETTLPYKNKFKEYVWFGVNAENKLEVHSPKVEMGQGIFTALAQIVAEEIGARWEDIRVIPATTAHGPVDPLSTGGSLSVSGLYMPLRLLAANFREIMAQTAAEFWKSSKDQIKIENGFASFNKEQKKLNELIPLVKNWEISVKEKDLKPVKDFKVIGKSLPRLDLKAKVQGQPIFGIDAGFEGMVYASVLRPPVFGSKLISATATKAETMPGVIKVVIEPDFVAVAAKSRIQAEDAKRQVEVKWELPAKPVQQADIEALVKVGEGKSVSIQKNGSTGNVFDLEAEYSSPLGAHAHIEPNGAVAVWENGKLIVRMSTQVPRVTQKFLADKLKIPTENIDIQPQYLGGGFGRRLNTPHALEAARISKIVGKPVHMFFERSEEFQNGFLRPPSRHTLKAKIENGKIVAMEHHTASANVAFDSPLLPDFVKPMSGIMAKAVLGADFGAWRGGMILYHGIENYKTVAYHNALPFETSWWRGLGLLANTFAIESFIDECAFKAGKDALEFRLEHLADDDSGKLMKAVLKEAAKISGWGRKLEPNRALGLACSADVTVPVAQVAEVEVIDGNIKVHKVWCAIDPGLVINPDGVKAQVEGAINMGLSATMLEEITIIDGKASPDMLGMYQMATLKDAPAVIEISIVGKSNVPKGVGEPPIGPIGAAIANAVFAATGKRLRKMPLSLA
jgi:isoquinoline 1-oxidoreductase subunit beta